jgi:hypothetical protein
VHHEARKERFLSIFRRIFRDPQGGRRRSGARPEGVIGVRARQLFPPWGAGASLSEYGVVRSTATRLRILQKSAICARQARDLADASPARAGTHPRTDRLSPLPGQLGFPAGIGTSPGMATYRGMCPEMIAAAQCLASSALASGDAQLFHRVAERE